MHPLIRSLQQKLLKKVPEIKAGYTVRVSQKVKEGDKERIQNFEGLVIKVGHGEGAEKTFTVRKIVEGIGVEKIFPMHSPNITNVIVKKKAKVRRSKLYYMRERFGKSARLTERHVTDEERAAEDAKMEEYINEAIKAEEKRKKAEEAKNEEETPETTDVSSEQKEITQDTIEEKIESAEPDEVKSTEVDSPDTEKEENALAEDAVTQEKDVEIEDQPSKEEEFKEELIETDKKLVENAEHELEEAKEKLEEDKK